MPQIRPGWTPKQSMYLQIAAIEFLRVSCAGGLEGDEYLKLFFEEWVMVYGVPRTKDGLDSFEVMRMYKARVIATIHWHAFAGRRELTVPVDVRIHSLKRRLQRDLFFLWDNSGTFGNEG